MTLKVLEDERITIPLDVIAMIALADLADDDGRVWRNPKMRKIAKRLRRSKRTAQRVIARLIANEFISYLQVGGGRETNIYQLYPLELGHRPIESEVEDEEATTPNKVLVPEKPSVEIAGYIVDGVTEQAYADVTRILYGVGNDAARRSLSPKRKEQARDLLIQLREQGADLSLLPRYPEWWKQDWRSSWDRTAKRCDPKIFQMPTALNILDTWSEFVMWLEHLEGADPTLAQNTQPVVARYQVRRSIEDELTTR